MRRIKQAKPSPALLIAIVALVAALAGTAVGGVAVTSLSNKDKKQVTKISKKQANKQIKKKAPGLEVKSAAASVNAQNADKLDGKDADQLQTSSGFGQRTDDLPLTIAFDPVVTTEVTTSGARIVATASVEARSVDGGNNDIMVCRVDIAGTESTAYSHEIPDTLGDTSTFALTFAQNVSDGTHTVTLECQEFAGNVTVQDAGLSAVAIGE